jgi:hypothetical protein
MKDRLSNVFGGFEFGQGAALAHMGKGPKLSQALETYLSLKGAGRPKTFEGGARRSVGYLMEVTDDKPIDAYQRSDANRFQWSFRDIGIIHGNFNRIRDPCQSEMGHKTTDNTSNVVLGVDQL